MARYLLLAQAALLLLLLAVGHPAAAAAADAKKPRKADPGTIPVAFEGSALLITFYSGVAEALLERGIVVPGSTKLSGLSGGAFTAASLHLRRNGTDMFDFWAELIGRCAQTPDGCAGRLNGAAEELLEAAIPKDAANLVNGGILRIAMSQLDGSKRNLNGTASWVVDTFFDAGDLKSALTSTDWIPCWTGQTVYTLFRNQPVIDGGYANGFKQMCPDGDIENCIKVASWYVGPDPTCDLKKCTSCGAPERQEPIPQPYINNYRYVDQMPLTDVEQRCPASVYPGLDPYPLPDFVPHNQTAVDIHPGKYSPLPTWDGKELLGCEWQGWALGLPKGREIEAMQVAYDHGYETASAWADEQGYN